MMIEISHVSYKYNGSRQEVFEDLNLTLQESSLVGIRGLQFHRSLSSLYAYPITQPTNVQQMNFSSDKPIYMQMADRLCDDILAGTYRDADRIPSVREYAVMLEVNTNTAMKAYDQLAREDIIYNKRGVGYFVNRGARKQILQSRRKVFMEQVLPDVFRQMRLLDIDIKEIDFSWDNSK